jgi:hypothetical protein
VKALCNESYKPLKKEIFLKKTTEDEKISHAYGMEESVLWKWLHYQKQPTCSMQSNQNSSDIHHRG